jgi:hypothetical protein
MLIKIIKTAIVATLVATMAEFSACTAKNSSNNSGNPVGFCEKFNKDYDDNDILLGCIVYSLKAKNKIHWDSENDFLKISADFHEQIDGSSNTDSLLIKLIKKNKDINLGSDEAYIFINRFVEDYHIVDNLIFGKVNSDTDESEMKIIEKKILKIPNLTTIYRFYVTPQRNDMSSLSSNEGIALNIQFAYYLSLQDEDKLHSIIKQLL